MLATSWWWESYIIGPESIPRRTLTSKTPPHPRAPSPSRTPPYFRFHLNYVASLMSTPLGSNWAFARINVNDILPFDIFHTIFVHAHATNPPGLAQERDVLSISQVSRLWRTYALVTPRLWSSVEFRGASLSHEATWIERSQNVMLEVTIRSLAPTLLPHAREILRPHGHRIRSLDLWLAPGDTLNVLFHTPEPISTPRLQQLAISSEYHRPVRCTLPFFPQLAHLRLGGFKCDAYIRQYRALRRLTLIDTPINYPHESAPTLILSVLESFPELEDLAIPPVGPRRSSAPLGSYHLEHPLTHPTLKSLSTYLEVLWDLLPGVQLPGLLAFETSLPLKFLTIFRNS